ncbi:helix-turn-helix domain-containing protein [Sphingobacterium haloxyli]|uniref:helix-turn-helix domain-containing protein n=1 Tax=Sphingobacterium haloxyli TaxID=2100533 RepID=UPI0021CE3B13|nr:helix-turn-helix domain-containing protein [Sphingobacterium haloxyli]
MAGKPRHLSQIKQMIRLHKQGYAIKSIARSLGISKNTVKSYLYYRPLIHYFLFATFSLTSCSPLVGLKLNNCLDKSVKFGKNRPSIHQLLCNR